MSRHCSPATARAFEARTEVGWTHWELATLAAVRGDQPAIAAALMQAQAIFQAPEVSGTWSA
ncbi:MAG: hypothetical protein FJZ47_09515 [Candidatus Tectomicrobia bacterium]|uniref:Uncharacterized protein n=1 Tax=Tectimicrobiota bacterium TaxID=2528274 RepID=A0A938B3T1_UNCTE|nr:hypothetical protein [Candidatus Tectomicrobia bacterium]